MTMTLFFK